MPRSKIIVIEDSCSDFSLLARSLKSNSYQGEINQFETAEDFLESHQEIDLAFSEKALILIDINLPGMSGHDFLKKINLLDKFSSIPKIFFTSSSDPKDVIEAYKNGANSYLAKPYHYDDYMVVSKLIIDYWLQHNVSTYSASSH